METYTSRSLILSLYSSLMTSTYTGSLRPLHGAYSDSILSGPLNGLDASCGNRCWSTATSSSFVPSKAIILARGYRVSAGGGKIGTLSNVACCIALVRGSDDWDVFFFFVVMVLILSFVVVLVLFNCYDGAVVGILRAYYYLLMFFCQTVAKVTNCVDLIGVIFIRLVMLIAGQIVI